MLFTPTLDMHDDQLVIPDLPKWIERYLFDCRQELKKEVTITHYSNALNRFVRWYSSEVSGDGIDRVKPKNSPTGSLM